jgi:hypothetical protein
MLSNEFFEVFMEETAQIFGIIGMIFNIIVFQQKKQKMVLLFQFFAAISFAANYFMLGAVIGGLLNLVGALRSVIYYFEKQTKANSIGWLVFFILAFASSYPLNFLVFKTPPTRFNLIIEILPVIAMIVATIAIKIGVSKMVRRLGLISSPLWLTYNCFTGSIGAILSEIFNLISIIVGIIRLDIRKKKSKK